MQDTFGYSAGTLIIVLALATLVIGLAVGIFQRFRVGKAKERHEHSALSTDPRFQNEHPAAVEARRRS